jgi:hypothetical protein
VVLPDRGSLFCRTTRSPTAERPSERLPARLVLAACDLAGASRVQHGQHAQLFFFFLRDVADHGSLGRELSFRRTESPLRGKLQSRQGKPRNHRHTEAFTQSFIAT